MARCRDSLGLKAKPAQMIDKHRGHFTNANVMRADGGMPDVVHDAAKMFVAVGVDMLENGGKRISDFNICIHGSALIKIIAPDG